MHRGKSISHTFYKSCSFLLLFAAVVLAHDHHDEHKKETHKHSYAMPANSTAPAMVNSSYWSLEGGKFLLYSHITIMVIDWLLVLPVAVMFAVAKSNLHAPTQTIFLLLNVFGLAASIIYDKQSPNLYPNNAHNKIGWAIVWMLVAHTVVGVIFRRGDSPKDYTRSKEETSAFISTPLYRTLREDHGRQLSYASDSAHGGSERSSTSNSPLRSPSHDEPRPYCSDEDLHEDGEDDYMHSSMPEASKFDRFLRSTTNYIPQWQPSRRVYRTMEVLYQIFQRALIVMAFVLFQTGIVVFCGIFRGNNVFNGIAHFAKGGIFFMYGFLTLGRYFGSCADAGWAWNQKPPASMVGWISRIPSVEFIESSIIFLYGAINIWLEHLAAWGQAWSPMDFEHVAISFMFIGGGMLGLLSESTKIRRLLNHMVILPSSDYSAPLVSEEELQRKHFNFNPVPALVWFILGIMMGGHHQEAMLGAMIHKLWGNALAIFSLFRLATYVLFWLSPPKSYLPTRPFTELLGAFCLTAGGLLFMASNRDTITYLMELNVDAMFLFTIVVGVTALLLSWETAVLAIKGWATQREVARRSRKSAPV